MPISDRVYRLKSDICLAILDNIIALNRQRKAAIQAGDAKQVDEIQGSINVLHARLDDLSLLSLETLENSIEVKQTITQLRNAANQLEDEADTIKDVANAIKKGAKIANQAAKIIKKLKG